MKKPLLNHLHLENLPYQNILEKQLYYHNQLKEKIKHPVHTLITCVHKPVFTLGKNANTKNLYENENHLKKLGFEVVQINRGGDITYHGPGQLVVYPILDLTQLQIGPKKYVNLLEKSIIKCLNSYQIKTQTNEINPGVWLRDPWRKIAALGIKISQGITLHGAAINLNTNLDHYNYINPCGLDDMEVTSLQKEIQSSVNEITFLQLFIESFLEHFSYSLTKHKVKKN